MIAIEEKTCCGCSACVEICPQACIKYEYKNGFKYPVIYKDDCINCHLCETVCPVINSHPIKKPIEIYAAKANDEEIRRCSSSGGLFSVFANHILNLGGIVIGVAIDYNNGKVFHKMIESIDELKDLRGSKYVESDISSLFSTIKEILQKGKLVLFSGTPCQVAGLKKFLRKDYPNLFLIDIICHGVSNPYVWAKYLDYLDVRKIKSINFRGKESGWRNYSFELEYMDSFGKIKSISESKENNIFLKGYAKNLFMRPSCENCSFKPPKGYSDITLGDFWGIWSIKPNIDDNKGVSIVCVNSTKGKEFFELILNKINAYAVEYEDVFRKYNHSYVMCSKLNPNSKLFYETLDKEDIACAVSKFAKETYKEQIKAIVLYVLTKTKLLKFVRTFRK